MCLIHAKDTTTALKHQKISMRSPIFQRRVTMSRFTYDIIQSTILLSMAVLSSRRGGGGDCKTYNEVTYDFRYSVDEPSSGVVMDQWENRSGEFVKGAYSMLDADGKIRTVHYEVDGKKGFQAIVKRKYPSTILLVNHLLYPKKYRAPYQHVKPVSLITRDLFDTKVRPYPNLPDT